MKTKHLLLAFALAGLAAPLARAQLDITLSGDIRLGRRPPPPPPEVVVVVDEGPKGPPPWVRSHWYQRTRDYYYYPGCDVYYRPYDRVWFYLDRGQWRSARNLPAGVRIEFDRCITLTMATNRPYLFHQQVITRYPGNYFGTRVRIRDDHRRDHDDHRDRDRDHGDRRSDRGRKDDGHDRSKDRGRN